MPEGGLEALNTKDPLTIYAQQYDIVCNGVELSSGAVRNHDVDTLIRAFEIAGYPKEVMISKFPLSTMPSITVHRPMPVWLLA